MKHKNIKQKILNVMKNENWVSADYICEQIKFYRDADIIETILGEMVEDDSIIEDKAMHYNDQYCCTFAITIFKITDEMREFVKMYDRR